MPVLQRARRGFRPRRPVHLGGARRRRVDHQRSEGVDLRRADRRRWHAPRPHRSRRPQAPGHHLLRVRRAPARRRHPPAQGDDGPLDVQRGVPHRRARPRRRRRRRCEQRLGRRQHHAHVRARRPRRRGGRRRIHRQPGNGGGRSRSSGRRLRRQATDVHAIARDVRRRREPVDRAGEGQRQDRRPADPPRPHAPPHPQRDRAADEPARRRRSARGARKSPAWATWASSR